MKLTATLIIFLLNLRVYGSDQTDLTAQDILNRSIEFCGGIVNISKIKSSELHYDVTTGDGSHASIIIKRLISEKYMRSLLSDKHIPASMHFDGSILSVIDGEVKTFVKDLKTIEEIKLQTYNQPQIGYKELSYVLTRLDDQKFNHFDCYVVRATAINGYATLNYFDKANFRLIMIIYPGGNKSLLKEYAFKDSVLFNIEILNVEENSEQMTWTLRKLNNNVDINLLWFTPDKSKSTAVPENIKRGTFISSDGSLLVRTDSTQTEKSPKEDYEHKLFLVWFNNYTYAMVNSKSINKQEPFETGDNISVKIVCWNKDEYVCHYYSNKVAGTQEYKLKQ